MKTKFKVGKFKPISFTLETEDELHDMINVCLRANWNDYPISQDLFNFLANFATIYPRKEKEVDNSEKEQKDKNTET